MNSINFPAEYKKALVNKTKNTTIRTGKEISKYKVGKTYSACSYAGNDWHIKVKITKVTKTTVSKLEIPKKSLESLKKKEKLSNSSKVEVIQFRVL